MSKRKFSIWDWAGRCWYVKRMHLNSRVVDVVMFESASDAVTVCNVLNADSPTTSSVRFEVRRYSLNTPTPT